MAKTKKTEEVIDTMLKKERMAGDLDRLTGKFTAKVGPESMDIKLIPNPMPQTPERIAKARELSKAEQRRIEVLGPEAYPASKGMKMSSPKELAKAAQEKELAANKEKKKMAMKD
jgi:hypothetical protein